DVAGAGHGGLAAGRGGDRPVRRGARDVAVDGAEEHADLVRRARGAGAGHADREVADPVAVDVPRAGDRQPDRGGVVVAEDVRRRVGQIVREGGAAAEYVHLALVREAVRDLVGGAHRDVG